MNKPKQETPSWKIITTITIALTICAAIFLASDDRAQPQNTANAQIPLNTTPDDTTKAIPEGSYSLTVNSTNPNIEHSYEIIYHFYLQFVTVAIFEITDNDKPNNKLAIATANATYEIKNNQLHLSNIQGAKKLFSTPSAPFYYDNKTKELHIKLPNHNGEPDNLILSKMTPEPTNQQQL
ncbi:hypothetical protein F7U66_01145 [Vibrio parahaemolyticus]|nr:hypothetical protein [Vibrio parahaemolyticus]